MDIGVFIANLAKDPVFIAVFVLLLLSLFNVATGGFRAWQNGVFTWSALRAWVNKDAGSIIPVFFYLGLGKALALVPTDTIGLPKEISGLALVAYGLVQAATVAVSLIASIQENLSASAQAKTAEKAAKAETIGDPVPDA